MTFTIRGRIPSKKNSKRIVTAGHRMAIVSSKDYMAWHTIACYEIKLQAGKQFLTSGPHAIEIIMWGANAVKWDLSNKLESLMDLMVDCGILADDNWSEVPDIHVKFGGVDRVDPRAEIKIEQIKQ